MKNIENIEQILRELKFINPEINEKDEKLKLIVSQMLKAKPQIENKTFKANLKKEIMKEIALRNKKAFNFFPFKTLGFLLSGAAFSYAVFITVNPSEPINNIKNITNTGSEISGNELSLKDSGKIISSPKEISKPLAKISPKTNVLKTEKANTEIKEPVPENNQKIDNKTSETKNSDLAMAKIAPSNTSSDTSSSFKSIPTNQDNQTQANDSISGTQDTGMTADISADRTMPMTMGLMMALPPKKDFVQTNFINFIEKSYSGTLIPILKSSEIKLENDILTIKASSKSDFDTINIPENMKIIKDTMSDFYGFYGEIKVNY
ncbi:MAG: hypothetical protein PHG82_04640 [Candidatus Gracilibacteria bacterium]|nr:hypothetical protein [Candidatus Gracilibacteria bacterium]